VTVGQLYYCKAVVLEPFTMSNYDGLLSLDDIWPRNNGLGGLPSKFCYPVTVTRRAAFRASMMMLQLQGDNAAAFSGGGQLLAAAVSFFTWLAAKDHGSDRP
jgi:hypothetical protein